MTLKAIRTDKNAVLFYFRVNMVLNTFFLQWRSLFVFPVAQKKCALVATVPHLTSNVFRKYSRRIRVEQVIQRIKSFNMLKYEVPITLLHVLDEVFVISCAICNMMPPISRH